MLNLNGILYLRNMCFDFRFRLICIDKFVIYVFYFLVVSRVLKIMCGVINFIKF